MKNENSRIEISNPAFDYDSHGHNYSWQRQTDPRIEAYVHKALGNAVTVLNVGAGAGSYEPDDKYVSAIEPSAVMRAQRLAKGKVPAINATAGNLPFDDSAFDASMAIVTVHHWPNIPEGLKELRRVTKGPVVIMTFDPEALHKFWSIEYFPELIEVEKLRYPNMEMITNALGGNCEIIEVPVPFDCVDGFQEAFYGRPEAFLDKRVRQSQSAWGFLSEGMEENLVANLAKDLESGEWDRKHGHYRNTPYFTCALRLIISR